MNKWRLVLVFCFAAVLLAIAVWSLRTDEPRYRGKPLSAWWDTFSQLPSPDESPAEWEARWAMLTNVVLSIGTNALPFYISCLDYKPPPRWYERL